VAIDFQDAVIGPVTYDLVSLLKDCYCTWPRAQVETWVEAFYESLDDHLKPATFDEFLRDFDLMGLQRHIKVLGVFARLYLRDGKPGYLPDLPRVIDYVEQTLELYRESEPCIAGFQALWLTEIRPVFELCDWYQACE
jgi:aminoglycoside/choline kinase family phosphotransferase